jgi:hypothetical protein
MSAVKAVWDVLVALAILVLCAMVVWTVFTGRSLIQDVENLVNAVRYSTQPIGPLERVPACPTEDAPGPCYWDADTMGNGEGKSFTVDRFGNVTYWGE